MPLQDLTPQLRTRLNRVERLVGIFVTVATLLLLVGFIYYFYNASKSRGWFTTKVEYSTGLNNAAGLKEGDDVKLMGFNVGKITRVTPEAPGNYYGVTVYFQILDPYYGYIWLDSKVRIAPADLLGNRNLEIVKGYEGSPTVFSTNSQTLVLNTDLISKKLKEIKAQVTKTAKTENPDFNDHAMQMEVEAQLAVETQKFYKLVKDQPNTFYVNAKEAKPFWIDPVESAALADRLESLVNIVESALPNILDMTNTLTGVLTNASSATARLDSLLADAQPIITNVAVITGNIRDPKGSLGEWLIPTNLNQELQTTLTTANSTLRRIDSTLEHTDTNLVAVLTNLNNSLESLAGITSNLNMQVQANTNIVTRVSDTILHSDEFIQGIKRHWFLRSAFKTNKTDNAEKPKSAPLRSPKAKQ